MKLSKINKLIKQSYKESKKKTFIVYSILRILVILCMILQIINGNFENAVLCLFSLVLLVLPFFIQKGFKITFPNTLEIIILLFIFASEILGEIQNFYGIFPFWDTMLHTINGFLAAAIGFSLINLLNKNSEKFSLSPFYLCLVAFCFSMTIGVLWEFFEFGVDQILDRDMQKDRVVEKISSVTFDPNKNNKTVVINDINHTILYDGNNNELAIIKGGYLEVGIIDTMSDLLVNFIGAIAFCTFGYFYLKTDGKNKFISYFVPQKVEQKGKE